jgi:hypothetical protein
MALDLNDEIIERKSQANIHKICSKPGVQFFVQEEGKDEVDGAFIGLSDLLSIDTCLHSEASNLKSELSTKTVCAQIPLETLRDKYQLERSSSDLKN